MPTSKMATAKAGRTIPVRWNRPRLRRELRDRPVAGPFLVTFPVELLVTFPVEPRGAFAELSDSVIEPVEAGLAASSVAVRCRDNAVPSVYGAPGLVRLPLPINDARKKLHMSATSARKMREGLPGIQ